LGICNVLLSIIKFLLFLIKINNKRMCVKRGQVFKQRIYRM